MKISLERPTTVVPHPADQSFTVTIRLIDRAEAIQLDEMLKRKADVKALVGPDGEILRNKGVVEVHRTEIYPLEVIHDLLRMVIVTWSGLEGADGRPIQYAPDKVGLLLSRSLDHEGTPFWETVINTAFREEAFGLVPFVRS